MYLHLLHLHMILHLNLHHHYLLLLVLQLHLRLLLLLLDDGADGVVELWLGDGASLLPARHAEVRGGVRGEGNFHLDGDLRHVLLGLLHAVEGAPQDLVEVRAQGVEGVAFQRQGQIILLAHGLSPFT